MLLLITSLPVTRCERVKKSNRAKNEVPKKEAAKQRHRTGSEKYTTRIDPPNAERWLSTAKARRILNRLRVSRIGLEFEDLLEDQILQLRQAINVLELPVELALCAREAR